MNLILNTLKSSLIYSLAFIFSLLIFGLFFSIIEKKNSSSIYRVFGRKGLVITGMIGTVVHEFSHMVFCIIFRHRVDEFSLFRPMKSRYDRIMGYVNHSCDRRSLYQNIGNFFIGIAPIIFGTGFLILSMAILLPGPFYNIMSSFNRYMVCMSHIQSPLDSVNVYVDIILTILSNLSPLKQDNFIMYIIFIYIMFSTSSHMDLSKEDLQNSSTGFFAFFVFIFILNFVSILIGKVSQVFILKILVCIFGFLTVGLIFAIITMTISFLLELLFAN